MKFLVLLIVQSYQDFACCAAVKGNGSNVEYALHLLYLSQGDIQVGKAPDVNCFWFGNRRKSGVKGMIVLSTAEIKDFSSIQK